MKRDSKVRGNIAMRAQGLRPIQIWVPDVRSPTFLAEAQRQSLVAANSPQAAEDRAFVDSISAWSPDGDID